MIAVLEGSAHTDQREANAALRSEVLEAAVRRALEGLPEAIAGT
jgi:hypothetical protein